MSSDDPISPYGAFVALIRSELDKRGWSMRELARATQEAAERLAELGVANIRGQRGARREDRGLSASMISLMLLDETDLSPSSLRLLSVALDIPLRQILKSLGYDVDAGASRLVDRKARIVSVLEAAHSLELVERVVALSQEDQRAVEAFLRYLQEGIQ